MNERTKARVQRIMENFNRQLAEATQDKALITAGALMKLMTIVIEQLGEIQEALRKEGIAV